MPNDEDLVLKFRRASDSKNLVVYDYKLSGDANFIWEQIGLLLCDHLLAGFSLARNPVRDMATKITEDR